MDYIAINNYSRLGKIGISRVAVRSIAEQAVATIPGVKVIKRKGEVKPTTDEKKAKRRAKAQAQIERLEAILDLDTNGVRVSFNKDGVAIIKIEVALQAGTNVAAMCLTIQKEVASAIAMSCEGVNAEVHVKVVKVG